MPSISAPGFDHHHGDEREAGSRLVLTRGEGAWLVAQGALAIVLGVLAFVLPVAAGLAITLVLGWVLILSAAFAIVGLFRRKAAHPLWTGISAVAGLVAGGLILWNPFAGAVSVVLVIAAFMLLDGITHIATAIDCRRAHEKRWGWTLTVGILDIVLAVALGLFGPLAAVGLIGVVLAINLLLGGTALISLGAARNLEPRPRD